MSLINDITAAVGTRSAVGANGQQSTLGTGQQPGGPNAAQQIQGRFGGVFQTTFTGTMATVYERGASGEFDDQTLALAEQAAMHRLRAAQQQAANVQPVAAGSVPAGPEGGIGGDAPVGDAAPGSVMGGGGTAPVGANAAPDAVSVGVSEQRELHAVRVRQSEARLANISQTLARDLPLAAGLVSASSGTWDPATFVPQTKHQAEALAHRLVVDGMEAAARLEIVKTQLDGAVFEVSQGGGAGAQQLAAELTAAYERQKSYVDKLLVVVDRQSSGQVTEAGEDALAGNSLRDAGDLPVDEMVAALRAEGVSEDKIKRLVGAGEIAVEQERTPGGSPRLKSIASDMTRTLLADFARRMEKFSEDRKKAEEQRSEERRIDNKRAAKLRVERQQGEQAGERARSARQMSEQAGAQRAATQEALFQQWLAQLSARA